MKEITLQIFNMNAFSIFNNPCGLNPRIFPTPISIGVFTQFRLVNPAASNLRGQ